MVCVVTGRTPGNLQTRDHGGMSTGMRFSVNESQYMSTLLSINTPMFQSDREFAKKPCDFSKPFSRTPEETIVRSSSLVMILEAS